jgi:hypothetical protein
MVEMLQVTGPVGIGDAAAAVTSIWRVCRAATVGAVTVACPKLPFGPNWTIIAKLCVAVSLLRSSTVPRSVTVPAF